MEIFDYDNILLLPRKCRVESRSRCDASTTFGLDPGKLPVVPANMKTVIDGTDQRSGWPATTTSTSCTVSTSTTWLCEARMRDKGLYVSISSGVKAADVAMIDRLAAEGVGADYITIDIAHGHAESVRKMIEHIKQKLPSSFVIAGNVATPEAVIDLENWGADATKVGVGPARSASRS